MSAWLDQIFNALQANRGGVVRRSVHDVNNVASEKELLDEAKARGFHVLENGDQYIIFCNGGEFRLLC